MTSKVGKTRSGDEEEERVQTGIEEESDVREMYVYEGALVGSLYYVRGQTRRTGDL